MAKKPGYDHDKLTKIFSNLREAFTKLEVDAYKEIGDYVRDRIVSKARQGKQVVGGKEKKLDPLSNEGPNSYVDQRKRYAKTGKGPHGVAIDETFFSPNRANNTLTGQFLESIKIEKIDQAKGEITIGPGDGDRKGEKLTNKTLSGYLKKMGRSIFAIDETARKVLLNKLKRRVRDQIKKKNLSK
jgi:hypothetical protein